jgi:hypothetical protein
VHYGKNFCYNENCGRNHVGFSLGLFFGLEDGGDIFLGIVG